MTWTALVLVTSVVVSLVRGGKLSNLAEIRIRAWWLLPLGLAMQAAATLLPEDRSWSDGLVVGLILGSYVPLLVAILVNHAEVGLWIAGVGILMNFTVIAANGGMPVLASAAVIAGAEDSSLELDAKHVVMDENSHLVFLADVIPVPFLRQVLSMGDVFLAIGAGMFIEDQLRQPLRWFRKIGSSPPGSAAGDGRAQ